MYITEKSGIKEPLGDRINYALDILFVMMKMVKWVKLNKIKL